MLLFCFPSSPVADLDVLPGAIQEIGKIRQGTSTKLEFKLQNRSSVAIQILNVGTSCGCTTSELSQNVVRPSESLLLTLTYNSGQLRGPINVQAIVVYQRDGAEQPQSLVLRALGEIDPDYSVLPERLEFEEFQPAVRRLVLWPRYGNELRLESAICDKRFFTAQIIDVPELDRQAVDVSFQPNGYYTDAGPAHIAIHTNSERQPVLVVPLDVISTKTSLPRLTSGN